MQCSTVKRSFCRVVTEALHEPGVLPHTRVPTVASKDGLRFISVRLSLLRILHEGGAARLASHIEDPEIELARA
jgi:hypothetical protein